ncbi:MAG: flagellar motor switch protein FliG [Paracoccus denitrificans]|nr:MAG: flagellar motor switch protein FliG [Paracoccus denitrificans]PZO85331.1 MAG: flagellar motor switch protein FliG [Paracoccus denitrificans]
MGVTLHRDDGGLTRRQKAAVIVRLMLADGADLPIRTLTPEAQARLAQDMATMELIDRDTRDNVVAEFCDMLEAVGVSFPGTIDGALNILDGHLSAETSNRLRQMAVMSGAADPWDRLAALPADDLADLARGEAVEVAAVMMSRLTVTQAADVFALLDPQLARQVAYAMSLTGGIEADALHRIGMALMRAADALPRPALEGGAPEKVGAILNISPSVTRDTVLTGLDEDDANFAARVRKAIFTFAAIPARIEGRDIPRILRGIDQAVIVRAMAGARGDDSQAVEFILGNLSTRLSDSLREEIAGAGRVTPKDAEEAMAAIVTEIRRMESDGELFLLVIDDGEIE